MATSTVTFAVIAAALGFIYGSVPVSGTNRGWRFDFPGAVAMAMAAAGIVGGIVQGFSVGFSLDVIIPIVVGVMLIFVRYSGGPRVPKGSELASGINRVPNDVPAAKKFAVAERMFRGAAFRYSPEKPNFWATRSPREWRHGERGMDAQTAGYLATSLAHAMSDTFAVLVILVRELPNEPNEPGVIVVRDNLRQVKSTAEGITVPGMEHMISAKSIVASVGYAFRWNTDG